MLEDTRVRIIAILKTITPLNGTRLTIADYTPLASEEYAGYFMTVRLSNESRGVLDTAQFRSTARWLIEVYSPAVGLGLRSLQESRIYQYVDAVVSVMDKNRLLTDPTTKQNLAGIVSASVVTTRVSAPIGYPSNQQQAEFYLGEVGIDVVMTRSKRC